jgi:hypothetical protein
LHVAHKDSKTSKTVTTPEDAFTALFQQQAKAPAAIFRGHFARYSHDKVLIVSKNGSPATVLTGSTNFSVTGLYVNANHVLVFDDANVATEYSKVFNESWNDKTSASAFQKSSFSTAPFSYQSPTVPRMSITFSPHTASDANKILGAISSRITQESSAAHGSVLFAVMQLTGSDTPVYNTLNKIYADKFFSYGISDAPDGTHLYAAGSKKGVLVTGKPGKTTLPAPFDQVPIPPGHEIHDKFVVCGLNGSDPIVYCGSSNLATGGEKANGDNLLQIHDADVATAFAIEALLLVDHYNFLDRYAGPKKQRSAKNSAVKRSGAKKATPKTAGKRSKAKKATGKRTRAKQSRAKKLLRKRTSAKKATGKKSAKKRRG